MKAEASDLEAYKAIVDIGTILFSIYGKNRKPTDDLIYTLTWLRTSMSTSDSNRALEYYNIAIETRFNLESGTIARHYSHPFGPFHEGLGLLA